MGTVWYVYIKDVYHNKFDWKKGLSRAFKDIEKYKLDVAYLAKNKNKYDEFDGLVKDYNAKLREMKQLKNKDNI
uniref:Uncharacterized protein n=1 Tax=viral metagenome TaxID=1070528 RepID=A0A6C0JTS2_9ZZZZ